MRKDYILRYYNYPEKSRRAKKEPPAVLAGGLGRKGGLGLPL
jgi:hypothetical protein